jgi:hypothetical protein
MLHKHIGREGMHSVQLAEDGEHWQSLVKTDVHLRIPRKALNFLTS